LQDWTRICTGQLPQGGPACVMVVADLMPNQPGEEAILILLEEDAGYARFEGLSLRDGYLQRHSLWATDGQPLPGPEAAATIIAGLQSATPPLSAAPVNQIGLPEGGGLALTP
jgi:hypothetical protein